MKVGLSEKGRPRGGGRTGSGCKCAALLGYCGGAAPEEQLTADIAALLTMGIVGELAYEKAGTSGNGSLRAAWHDAVSRMDSKTLLGRAKLYEA